MPRGSIKWFARHKNFGFITPEKGGSDIFLHISAVEEAGITDSLTDNLPVEYESTAGPDGRPVAINLKLR